MWRKFPLPLQTSPFLSKTFEWVAVGPGGAAVCFGSVRLPAWRKGMWGTEVFGCARARCRTGEGTGRFLLSIENRVREERTSSRLTVRGRFVVGVVPKMGSVICGRGHPAEVFVGGRGTRWRYFEWDALRWWGAVRRRRGGPEQCGEGAAGTDGRRRGACGSEDEKRAAPRRRRRGAAQRKEEDTVFCKEEDDHCL